MYGTVVDRARHMKLEGCTEGRGTIILEKARFFFEKRPPLRFFPTCDETPIAKNETKRERGAQAQYLNASRAFDFTVTAREKREERARGGQKPAHLANRSSSMHMSSSSLRRTGCEFCRGEDAEVPDGIWKRFREVAAAAFMDDFQEV
jgi:hypothetical protein